MSDNRPQFDPTARRTEPSFEEALCLLREAERIMTNGTDTWHLHPEAQGAADRWAQEVRRSASRWAVESDIPLLPGMLAWYAPRGSHGRRWDLALQVRVLRVGAIGRPDAVLWVTADGEPLPRGGAVADCLADDLVPDLTDPGTIGCLEEAVIRAYGGHVVLSRGNGWWTVETDAEVWDQDTTRGYVGALLRALSAGAEVSSWCGRASTLRR